MKRIVKDIEKQSAPVVESNDPSLCFKKLLEECNQLNANMQRANVILQTGGKEETSNNRLYGLHYGAGAKGQYHQGRTLDQLHSQLIKDRSRQPQNASEDYFLKT